MARAKTSPSSSTSPAATRRNPLRPVALGLLIVATGLSFWLVHLSLSQGPVPGCDGGNCGLVLGSKWAKVFGVPVGVFGAAAYAMLAVLGSRPFTPGQRGLRTAAAALVLLIPAAALWFVALQVWVVKAFCPWCCTTHAIAVAGAVMMALAWRRDAAGPAPAGARRGPGPGVGPSVWVVAGATACAAFAGFVVIEAISPEPPKPRMITASMATPAASPQSSPARPRETPAAVAPTNPPPAGAAAASPAEAVSTATNSVAKAAAGPRRLRLHDNRFNLDPYAYPVNGSPDAEHLILMVSDYTCPHCRAAYKILKEVREVFDGQRVGILMLPSHHGGDSQELQLLMLSAWKVDPGVWAEVAADLYLEHLPLKPDVVRQVLMQRLGPGRLESSMEANRPWIQQVFDLAKEVHAANKLKAGSGSIPQFVIGQEIVVGTPADAAEIFQLFEKNLGLVRDRYPELRLAITELDLGRVFAGTGQAISVAYTNTGTAPLQLSRVAVPSGGRVVRGLQVPVEPGGTGAVDVAVSVPRDAGPFEQTLKLFSNGRVAEQPLQVKGVSWRPLHMEPAILDFGRIDPDASTPTQAVMRIEFDEPAKLQSATSQNAGFDVVLREVMPERSYELVVRPTKSIQTGAQQATLMVSVQKPVPPGWPENLAFAARAMVERAVSAMPPRLYVPAGSLPSERHHQVLVRCADSMAGFQVLGAVLEGGPAFTQPEIQPGTRANEFMVRMTLPAGWSIPAPPVEAKLIVRTNHPKYPTVEIPVSSQGR